ncbi:MAG: BlaI/MecI/CopY family transcriptional regulator, partial [Acidobacteriia bacterium]|nr:BlaI/MecI/CopY family transcriptional regulator [Terriglobia bacterium]
MRQKLNTPGTDLSPLERQLMEILWKEKSSTAEEIRAALAPRHPLMDSTVRTVLRRLEDKGYVTHTVQGKAFVYRGVEPPRSVAVRAVRM